MGMEADLTPVVLTDLHAGTARSRGKGTRPDSSGEEGGRMVMLHLRHLQTPETLINRKASVGLRFSAARLSLLLRCWVQRWRPGVA